MKRLITILLSIIMLFTALSITAYGAVKAPSAPKVNAVSSTVKTVTLKWKKVNGAAGYEVYSYSKKKYKKLASVKTVKYTVKKLKPSTGYIYSVRAYTKSGKKKKYSNYSKLVKVATLPVKPGGLRCASKTFTTVTLNWNKVSGATNYTVKYSTDSVLKSNVKTAEAKTNSVTLKGLSDGKSYYYSVCANYKYNKKIYSSEFSEKAVAVTKTIPDKSKVNVTLSKSYQTIDGFGTSSAWNFQKIGARSSADKIIKYLYDPSAGIGLNIYRYNVGTGSRRDDSIYDYWHRTDGFIKSIDPETKKITYDFTKDAEAQNCLKLAKKYAGNSLRLTLFHNSPPVEMTVNGKAFCNSGVSNLASENFGLYSDFCIGVADYFVKQGYRVTDVSPVNEPIYGWDGNNQEGCYYEPEQLSQLLAIMASKARGKSYKISMFEAGAAEAELENGETPLNIKYFKAITGNKTNSAYYDSVSVHSYWSNKERKAAFRSFINKYNPNMKIACTEYCQMTNDGSTGVYDISSPLADNDPERNGLGIEYGLQMARTVYEDLTVLNASEWDWWLGVSNGYYPDGLVYIDHNDSDDSVVLTSKRLWCLGNFSRFIKEGAKRIEVTSVNDKVLSCGFKNPDGSVALVLINTTENNYGTNICLDGYSSYKTYITSASKDLAYSTGGTFEKGSAVSLPAKSVVSVIITK